MNCNIPGVTGRSAECCEAPAELKTRRIEDKEREKDREGLEAGGREGGRREGGREVGGREGGR